MHIFLKIWEPERLGTGISLAPTHFFSLYSDFASDIFLPLVRSWVYNWYDGMLVLFFTSLPPFA